jgi:hypothetical protein
VLYLRRFATLEQTPCAATPFYTWDFADGARWAAFYRTSSGYMIRFESLADFEVSADGRGVGCRPAPDVSDATIEHLYLNQVLPLALSKLGKLVFHGSAVEIGSEAFAFLGESGRGKSTIAAGLAVGGHRFLTDDGLVLESADGIYQAQPSHPSLRLWQDSHEFLMPSDAVKKAALDYTTKSRFLAGAIIPHCDESRPLRAAYFLGNGASSEITFRRLTEAETMLAWARHSFLLDIEDRALVSAHFDRIAMLANSIACYNLDYPRRFDDLDRLIGTVKAHVTRMRSP